MMEPAIRPGRNAPCPCGSGRKYKRCCAGGESGTQSIRRHRKRLGALLGALLLVVLAGWGIIASTQFARQPDASAESGAAPKPPEPWHYDQANDRHWHPDHGHWHQGPPPPGR